MASETHPLLACSTGTASCSVLSRRFAGRCEPACTQRCIFNTSASGRAKQFPNLTPRLARPAHLNVSVSMAGPPCTEASASALARARASISLQSRPEWEGLAGVGLLLPFSLPGVCRAGTPLSLRKSSRRRCKRWCRLLVGCGEGAGWKAVGCGEAAGAGVVAAALVW